MEGVVDRLAGYKLIGMFVSRISYRTGTNSCAPIIQICLLCCCISDMGTDIVSSHICLQRQLVIRIASFFFNHAVDVTNVGGIVLICICIGSVSCSKAALNISNLTAIDTDTAIVLQVNLCTGSSLGITFASCCLVGNGCNACKVLGQLDFQAVSAAVYTDVFIRQLCAVCASGDIQLFIQFPCDNRAVIAFKFQSIIEGCEGMLTVAILVLVNDASDAILAVHAGCALFRLDDGHGVAVFAIPAGDADGAVFAILAIFADSDVIQSAMEGVIDRLAGNHLLRTIIILGHRASTNGCRPSFFILRLIRISSRCCPISSVLQISTNIGSIDASQLLQLSHVDGIGVVCTCGYAVDLASYLTIGGTNGYGCLGGLPSSSSICRSLAGSRIIAFYRITCYSCNRTTANSYTISNMCSAFCPRATALVTLSP